MNIAQRLEANAVAGGILLSYETYAHAQDMIEVEEKEAITMKGINREIQVYSVLSGKARLGANIDTSSHESIDRTTITTIAKMQNQLSKLMTESDHLKRELGNLKQKIDSSVSQNYRKK